MAQAGANVTPDAIESIVGVVLAAGAGRRMGGRPKALLERDGEALLARQLRLLAEAGVARIEVVLGHHAERIAPLLAARAAPGVGCTLNPAPEEDTASSLRCALAALPADAAGVLVLLGDQPLLQRADLQAVLRAWQARPAGIEVVLPTHRGQPGHPLVFGPAVRRAVAEGQSVRDWRRAHPGQVQALAVDHPRYTCDVDDEAARAEIAAQHGVRLSWPADLATPQRPSSA